jgi:hypothetical protein
MQYDINKQYEKLDKDVMGPAVERVMSIVQDLAKKEDYDLILPSESVIYHSDRTDITSVVIQALDRQAGLLGEPASAFSKDAKGDSASDDARPKASRSSAKSITPSKSRRQEPE